MARLLVATVPLTGHVQPMLLLVRTLIERGHEVRWCAGRKFASAIESTGAAFAPMRPETDWDDADIEAALPGLRGKRGLSRVKAQLRAMFISPMCEQLQDLESHADDFAPDAVLADSAHLGASLLSEKRDLPWAGLGISALVVPSIDTAPFGSALPPGGPSQRGRNRFLNWLIFRCLFGTVNRSYRSARASAALPSGDRTYFDVLSPHLFLQPTIPAFEYPRSDLAPQVHFIGPLVPKEPASAAALPQWWSDVEHAKRSGTPIVLVTQGTLATNARELIAPTLEGLASENVLVVATTGRSDATQALGTVPDNARVASYVPYHALMPHLSAVVTNGGYGGVQMALAHGLPLIVAGGSEEKPEIAARVAWSGSGINLKTGRPRPSKIRNAWQRMIGDPTFANRARTLAKEMAQYDARNAGADLIEALVDRRAPILRTQ